MSESHCRLPRRAALRATLILGAACLAFAGDARADEPRVAVSLNWIRLPGAEDCIDAAELARTVEQQLGRSIFVSPTWATRVIEGWSEPADNGWRVFLRASDAEGNASGQREFTTAGESCSSLNRSIVLAVSLLAQSARGVTYAPPESSLLDRRPRARSALGQMGPPPAIDQSQKSEPGSLSPGLAYVGPTLDVGWGVLPDVATGAGLHMAFALSSSWLIEVRPTVWVPQGVMSASTPIGRADIAVGVCPVLLEGRAGRITGCGGAALSVITAPGATSAPPYFSGYSRAVAYFDLGARVWLTAALGIGLPFNNPTFAHSWVMSDVTGQGELGLSVHFGP